MLLYHYTFSFLCLCTIVRGQAQQTSISGRVIESESREPLWGATATIFYPNKAQPVTGIATDSLGFFKLRVPNKGDYRLEITFIGFQDHVISQLSIAKNIDFGTIALVPSDVLLNEVEVTGEKSTLINNLDKKVYNLEKDLLSETSSASEILQNIPSVSVDINGGISIRNTTNITIFINGRPSAVLRRNASAVLSQMPASSIERVEIITNPSAKYRPDGVGGIINIILKKDSRQGLNGQFSVNAGTENRQNGNINLNYGTEKFNLFGNYGIRHSNATFLHTDNRTYQNPGTGIINSTNSENGNTKTNALSHNLFAGINYELNEANTLEFSGTYFFQKSFHRGLTEIVVLNALGDGRTDFTNRTTNDEYEGEAEASLSFEHIFKGNEDHTLTFESSYSAYDEQEDLKFNQFYTFPDNTHIQSGNLLRKGGDQKEISLDYTWPINEESEFDGGYAGEFVHEDIRYSLNTTPNWFVFDQEIHALYALYGHSLGDFSYKVGLRAEQSYLTSHLKIPKDSLYPNTFFKLFPTLYLGYELNQEEQLSLSYSKRINRPDADELNPNPEFSDPRNAEVGNPNLKPEQVHSVEAGYQLVTEKLTWTNALYFRYTYDAFSNIRQNIGDSIVLVSSVNLDSNQAFGLETVLSGNVKSKWDYDLTGNLFYTTIDAANLGITSRKSAVSGVLKGYSLIKLGKSTSLQLNGFYNFPTVTPQGKRNSYFYMNGGLKQQLFQKKASLILTATDIFHTYRIKYKIRSEELEQTTTFRRKLPVVYIGFVWVFNGYQSKEELEFEENTIKK